jgi:hypothetical protein
MKAEVADIIERFLDGGTVEWDWDDFLSIPLADRAFKFLSTCHVRASGHSIGVKPERFHLIATYETDARRWIKGDWIDRYSGKTYRITTTGAHGSRTSARVKTHGASSTNTPTNPEIKCADAHSQPCGQQTRGLLQRRHRPTSERGLGLWPSVCDREPFTMVGRE